MPPTLPTLDEHDGWYVRTWRGVDGGYVAEAKRTPFVLPDPSIDPIASFLGEGDDLWFEFGPTPGAALERLRRSLPDDPDDGR